MAEFKFGAITETAVTDSEFSLKKARDVLANERIAILGYGIQGPAQAMNLRDNGFNVIVGQRGGTASWERALADDWQPDVTLFPIEAASERASMIVYLLSDAAQIQCWPSVKSFLSSGKTLVFSHGFVITYSDKTQVIPPNDIDVIMVAPKGSGRSVRELYLQGRGVNSSFAVDQDASGYAKEKALAYGIGIGSGYLFETTFQKEVYSDLTGERGVLMGAIAGIMEAQYQVLRENGHTPSEAFNETVEELTQSLLPLVGENGMEWMFRNCSTTAQRGALDWMEQFKTANTPLFKTLYEQVKSGNEAQRVIDKNSDQNYRQLLDQELEQLANKEIWQVGKTVRSLRHSTYKKPKT